MKLKLRDNLELKDVEKYGFENGIYTRTVRGITVYQVYFTPTHRYLQINTYGTAKISGNLQVLIYNLVKDNIVEIEGL